MKKPMSIRSANAERMLGKPGVEYRAKDGREVILCPGDDIRSQGWHYGRDGYQGEWDWFPSLEEAEKFWRGEDAEVLC